MDDLFGKFKEILSDEESMKQIKELAEMLNENPDGGNSEPQAPSDTPPSDNNTDNSGGFDFGMLFKIQEIMSQLSDDDENTKLLLALKPHLSEKRQEKTDKAVKILKMLAILKTLKQNGMLDDLNKLF